MNSLLSSSGRIESVLFHALGITPPLIREKKSCPSIFRSLPGCYCHCCSAKANTIVVLPSGWGREGKTQKVKRDFSLVFFIFLFLLLGSERGDTSGFGAGLVSRQDNSGGKIVTSCQFDGTSTSAVFSFNLLAVIYFPESSGGCGIHFVQDL